VSVTQTEMAPETLQPQQLRQFEQEGYLVVHRLAPAEMVGRMLTATREGVDRQIEPIEYEADLRYPGAPDDFDAIGGNTIRRLKLAHTRGAVFTEWAQYPGLTVKLRQLLGVAIVMPLAHHNCIMTKMPGFSSETHWHQDIRYWNFEQPELISVWLALGTETQENGALQIIPGSHRIAFNRNQLDQESFFREDLAENQQLIETKRQVQLEAGDVLFFHCKTLHAAGRNATEQPKFSTVFTFRSADNRPLAGTRSTSLPELLIPG